MMRILLLLLLCLYSHVAFAEDPPLPQFEARLDRASAELGDRLTLEILLPPEMTGTIRRLIVPREIEHKVHIGDLRRASDTRYTASVRFPLAGDYLLDDLQVSVDVEGAGRITARLAPLRVEVKPLAEAEGEVELVAGYTDPINVPHNYLLRNLIIFAAAVTVLAVLAGLVWLVFWLARRQKVLAAQEPPVPPLMLAFEQLAELMKLDVYTRHGAERHYTVLSAIVRDYLERDTGRPVREMTEDELIAELRHGLGQARPGAQKLETVLMRSSMAKFARQLLDRDQALSDCREVETFFQTERQRLIVEEELRRAKVKGIGKEASAA